MIESSILLFAIVSSIMGRGIMVHGQVSSTESSAEYLHNVINQLQEHNRPASLSADRITDPGNDLTYLNNQQQQNNIHQQTDEAVFYNYDRYLDGHNQQPVTEKSVGVNNDQQFAESIAPHYQIQAPQRVLNPVQVIEAPAAPLGLTRNELALLYKRALQQGSPVSLSSVKNSLTSSHRIPQITGTNNQVRLNSGNPGYYYYFYPLKTFINELQDNHGSKLINHGVRPEHSDLTAESSQKQMANPLFMAISGFIGMALMFMASVLFVPKFENFGSRNSSDDFSQLTKVAWEAIEGRNCTERFACELNKVAVRLELSKRSRRLLEDVVPDNLRRQMIKMRKSKKKRQECKLILCKCA